MVFIELMQTLQGDATQEEFAAMLGITQTAVSAIYRGARDPGVKVLRGLVQAFPERSEEITASFFALKTALSQCDSAIAQTEVAVEQEEGKR